MQITTIGLDIAKNVFQVHGIDARDWEMWLRSHLERDWEFRSDIIAQVVSHERKA